LYFFCYKITTGGKYTPSCVKCEPPLWRADKKEGEHAKLAYVWLSPHFLPPLCFFAPANFPYAAIFPLAFPLEKL
jgi:hypothetical protein